MLAVVFAFTLLQGAVIGSRINVKAHHDVVESQSRKETIRGEPESAWTLSFSGIPCYFSDELEQLGPFANGIQQAWNAKNLFGKILIDGRNIGSEANCRLCNLEVKGSILNVPVGTLKPHVSHSMECAAEVEKLNVGCYTENGNLGKFHNPSPKGICTPCPEECDGGCTIPGTTDLTTSSKTWFKCITRDPKTISKSAVAEASSPKIIKIKSGYDCEAAPFSGLQQDAQEALSVGDSNIESKEYKKSVKPKFFKSKSREGQWNLWCKYKPNFAVDIAEDTRSPLVAEKSSWKFNAGISGCNNVQEMSQENFMGKLAKAAASKLAAQAESQNCEICESSFGGLMDTMHKSDAADLNGILQDLTGKAPAQGDEPLWLKAECAYELLGTAACTPGKGYVGWAEGAPCLPCPEECVSCTPDKKGSFKCTLKPIVSFPSPALALMTAPAVEDAEKLVSGLYKMPEDLDCSTPVTRNCKRNKKGEWCQPWQYKTVCKYGKLGNPASLLEK